MFVDAVGNVSAITEAPETIVCHVLDGGESVQCGEQIFSLPEDALGIGDWEFWLYLGVYVFLVLFAGEYSYICSSQLWNAFSALNKSKVNSDYANERQLTLQYLFSSCYGRNIMTFSVFRDVSLIFWNLYFLLWINRRKWRLFCKSIAIVLHWHLTFYLPNYVTSSASLRYIRIWIDIPIVRRF